MWFKDETVLTPKTFQNHTQNSQLHDRDAPNMTETKKTGHRASSPKCFLQVAWYHMGWKGV